MTAPVANLKSKFKYAIYHTTGYVFFQCIFKLSFELSFPLFVYLISAHAFHTHVGS